MASAPQIDRKANRLLSDTARKRVDQRAAEDETFAKRHGAISPTDCYRYRVQYILRDNGFLIEGPMFDTQIEALEAMHSAPVTPHSVALGVVRCRTFFGEQAA